MDFKKIENRLQPQKFQKYTVMQKGNSTVKTIQKVDYEYYICDCCGKEFKANTKKWHEKQGGILEYPISYTKSLKTAVCNECLKKTIVGLEKFYGR